MYARFFLVGNWSKQFKQKGTPDKCKWIGADWQEVSSLMEQRMCENASVFLSASKSSWSAAVYSQRETITRHHREMRQFRFDLYDKDILAVMAALWPLK